MAEQMRMKVEERQIKVPSECKLLFFRTVFPSTLFLKLGSLYYVGCTSKHLEIARRPVSATSNYQCTQSARVDVRE